MSKNGKYESFVVTVDDIRRAGACTEGIRWFNNNFPKGLMISNCTEEMVHLVSNVDETDCDYLSWMIESIVGMWSSDELVLPYEEQYDPENLAYLLSDWDGTWLHETVE